MYGLMPNFSISFDFGVDFFRDKPELFLGGNYSKESFEVFKFEFLFGF
jgi:hypothetical protein